LDNWKLELIRFYEGDTLTSMLEAMCEVKRDADDLKQELILFLLSMDEEKLKRLIQNKQLTFYCYGYLRNQYHSSSSEFYKKYRKLTYIPEPEKFLADLFVEDSEEMFKLLNKVDYILDSEFDFFTAFLFRKYYFDYFDEKKEKTIKGRSYRSIEKEYSLSSDFKIDHMFIYNSVTETLKSLKIKLKKEGLI